MILDVWFFFYRTTKERDTEWSSTWCIRLGGGGHGQRQAADGLGGKPGRVLAFLDRSLPDAHW